ncbi:MAG: AAA family ATPase [Candidatus Staskawiczbacteria bacterium]|nr:AAA family ATPase [Candidatus Staskawiczbacteria bacterium]
MLIGHKKQWEFLKNKFELGQLSHAYLFTGPKEIGKKMFATEFAGMLGCKFPDLMIVSEANKKDDKFGDGGEIKISQIREVQNFLSYKSYNGGYKVVVIDDAEKMNQEAQSCFLKTLEEPKGKTLLIMISSKPDMLLPTIISRCQNVKFFKPKDLPKNPERLEREQKILSDLIPVMSSTLADKFKYAKAIDFQKQQLREILEVMQRHFRKQLLSNFSDKKAKKFLEMSQEINKNLLFTNANPKLALEILLMEL